MLDKQFFNELKSRIEKVYDAYPELKNQRQTYPSWFPCYLGNPESKTVFIAQSISLSKPPILWNSNPEPEKSQWNITKGDHAFRDALCKFCFKRGTRDSAGGWNCYITNMIKLGYKPNALNGIENFPEALEIAKFWAPILKFELDSIEPDLIVLMGKKPVAPFFERLVRDGIITTGKARIETIMHYSTVDRGTRIEDYFNEFLTHNITGC